MLADGISTPGAFGGSLSTAVPNRAFRTGGRKPGWLLHPYQLYAPVSEAYSYNAWEMAAKHSLCRLEIVLSIRKKSNFSDELSVSFCLQHLTVGDSFRREGLTIPRRAGPTVRHVLLAFVVLDYITGVMCAIVDHKLSSEIGFKGIF